MLSFRQALILGILQGISELFPISSLAHSIILPALLGWTIDQNANYFLTFLVATHFATATVLFVIYRADQVRIIHGIVRSVWRAEASWRTRTRNSDGSLRLALYRREQSDSYFKSSYGKYSRRPHMQVQALLPGFSRTGSTIAGGLMVGLAHEDALRLSFLLATPIIGAAGALKLPMLFWSRDVSAIARALLGATGVGIAAYLSVKFLTRYFKTRTLMPFAAYCLLCGLVSFALLRR